MIVAEAMDMFEELWGLAKNSGPFATLFLLYLWKIERDERRECQKMVSDLTERATNGLNANATAIHSLRELFTTSKVAGRAR